MGGSCRLAECNNAKYYPTRTTTFTVTSPSAFVAIVE